MDAKDPGEIDVDTLISKTENLAPFLWYSITGGEVFIRKDFEKLVLEIQLSWRKINKKNEFCSLSEIPISLRTWAQA